MTRLIDIYRRGRIAAKQAVGIEPVVPVRARQPLEFHGNDYCGWCIPVGSISADSVIVDIGLGDDVSFSRSLIERYGCTVHGFDPTPRSIAYMKAQAFDGFVLHELGVGATSGSARFFLPNNESYISGSLLAEEHVGRNAIDVDLITLSDVMHRVGADHIDLLKMDIEGAEYAIIESAGFDAVASRVGMICIEFHHRWRSFGASATMAAATKLERLGFRCAWRSAASNEEFLFVREQNA